jgi:hypothetical protein
MKVKESFLSLGHFTLNIGEDISFWEDKWLGTTTLQYQFPELYSIVHRNNVLVASVFRTISLNISFRRGLVGNNLNQWYRLVARVAHIRLNEVHDRFIWDLIQNDNFSISSMYKALILDTRIMHNTLLWKLKIPLRIKIFLWYLKREVVLTKDNLARRNWNGGKQCVLCSQLDTIQHLFFDCHFARFLWRAVQVTFNIDRPTSVMHMFNNWAVGVGVRFKKLLFVGAGALHWELWTSRNEMVFDNSPAKTYMQLVY